MRRAARVDANHLDVCKALEKAGCSVLSLAQIGKGAPDILVGLLAGTHRCFTAEIKDGEKVPSKQKLTPAESKWAASWLGEHYLFRSAEEALQIVGEIRRGIR